MRLNLLIIKYANVRFIHIDHFLFLDFSKFLLSIVHHELLYPHVSSTDSNNQLTIYYLGIDLLGTKSIIVVSQSFNRYWAIKRVDIFCKQLVNYISLYCLVYLSPISLLLYLLSAQLVSRFAILHFHSDFFQRFN